MSVLASQADRLDAAVGAIVALRPRVEAAAPWPLAELYGTEAEASWGPPELLAHVEEMLPFWLGEVERILDGGRGSAVPFGRVASDTIRIGVIGRDRTVPLRELFARVQADGARVASRMRGLDDADAARRGLHQTRGELTVAELFERFVTGHLEDHVVQLRAILDARGA
ncbi:MAG: DinB family protein [Chloroflexi bacterium]|nr:DinB family protein [Chloroflexota bacterium]